MAAEFTDKVDLRGGISVGDPSLLLTPKTAAYTAKHTDGLILADATGGGFTITLPPANIDRAGTELAIKLTTATANTVTVAAAGSDTIDGAATSTLLVTSKKCLWLQSDGKSKWFIVGTF